ncbi:glycosyltransferase [Hydrogenimonas thermophila]|uniref:Glycosyltransferase involved in cell wall bisynthesis n=1 Tax=Hydrogenimonas thermophila TaxID=223786 RepID=A0A1I5KPR2_9BACT|nr:glycosyltransferase [Hydrogenimonas thermophila]SFO87089.1 Glycosyltransferase involved in cell wall bisynthesis [Hydrogenimonas thermophila]
MYKKEVIFFHPYFSDGGVERTNLTLAKGLIENNYKVTFLTTNFTNHFLKEIEGIGINFVSLGNKSVSRAIFDIKNFLDKKQEKVYFISCQYYVNVISMIVSKIVKNRNNIKFINFERNHLDEFKYKEGIKNKLIPLFVKKLYKNSDVILANSKETANDLQRFIDKKVEYVYNPTINKRLDFLKDENICEEWFLKDNRPFVLGIGRLAIQKDFQTLIKAFKLFNENKNYRLIILGDGELRNKLQEVAINLGIKNDVFMPGFVKNPYKFLIKADLFVLSSLYEGLPNVLIEALYVGSKVLSTNCKSGPKEILLNDDRFLCNVGDVNGMANKMKFLVKNEIKRDFSLERFKYENVIEKFIKVIEQ